MSSAYAFELATHDPNTAEKALIAGREVFTRRFTLSEVTAIASEIQRALEAALKDGKQFTVREEMQPVVKALNARVADAGKPIKVQDLLDALTDEDYRAILRHFAPALLGASAEGKAQ